MKKKLYIVIFAFIIAVVAFFFVYRYYNKQTTNPAFKNFWLIVHVLHAKCLKLIAQYEGEALFNTYVQPQLKEIGIDAATIEQLPTPVQKVGKGILPKGYFAKAPQSSDE